MSFKMAKYREPDFTQERFVKAPDAVLMTAPHAKAAPKGFHATSIFPEYFKIDGKWYLAEDSRMDAVPVWDGEKIKVVEFRNIKENDKIVVGRTEDASEGIYVHDDCWTREETEGAGTCLQLRCRGKKDYVRAYCPGLLPGSPCGKCIGNS